MVKTLSKKMTILIVVLALVASAVQTIPSVYAADVSIADQLQNTSSYLQSKTTKTDWAATALARSGTDVPASYFTSYYNGVVNEVQASKGILSTNRYTDYSRKVIALTAISKDPANVGGYNLVAPLSSYTNVIKQGINGPAYALIALDSYAYYSDARDRYVDYILTKEISGGGFALSGSTPDRDVTAMVLQALANYSDRSDVQSAITRGLSVINRTESTGAEGLAQVVVALSTLGQDPSKYVTELLTYANSDGGFAHNIGGSSNSIATEQSLYALVAYDRYLKGTNSLYNMTEKAKPGEITVTLNGRFIIFDQKPEATNNRTMVPIRAIAEAMGAEVTWTQSTQTVRISNDEYSIQFVIGSKAAVVNGNTVTFDIAPYAKNGRTLVPLRFVAEAFNSEVGWVQGLQRVEIVK